MNFVQRFEADKLADDHRRTANGQIVTLHCLWCQKRRFSRAQWRTQPIDQLVDWGQLTSHCSTDCFWQYVDYFDGH